MLKQKKITDEIKYQNSENAKIQISALSTLLYIRNFILQRLCYILCSDYHTILNITLE